MNRRHFLAVTAGTAAVGMHRLASAQDGAAFREFRILRDGSDIGRHRLEAQRTGDVFTMAVDIDIRVRFLGITAYRYELTNREVWRDQRLESIDSRTNDDGTDDFVKIMRVEDGLEVDGSGHSGLVPSEAVTTTYYTTAFMQRRPWVSSQTGEPLSLQTAQDQADGLTRWTVTGELETRLYYDERGEWVTCKFDASGEPAEYEVIDESGEIARLWAGV
ncbi:MAG: DUF6134 family protein [Pseudomonadota bacterium]